MLSVSTEIGGICLTAHDGDRMQPEGTSPHRNCK